MINVEELEEEMVATEKLIDGHPSLKEFITRTLKNQVIIMQLLGEIQNNTKKKKPFFPKHAPGVIF